LIRVYSSDLGVIGEFSVVYYHAPSGGIVGLRDGVTVVLFKGAEEVCLKKIAAIQGNPRPTGAPEIATAAALTQFAKVNNPKLREAEEQGADLVAYVEMIKSVSPTVAQQPLVLENYLQFLADHKGAMNFNAFRELLTVETVAQQNKQSRIYVI
jgi:methylthioribose-1-phosphate isomerase